VKKLSAFSLIELIVVLVIIGILAVLAIPAYQQYIINAKLSESYTTLDSIAKSETTYYNENQQFYHIDQMNPASLTDPLSFANSSAWDGIGYPLAVGTNVHFAYNAFAGKVDGTGTEITSAGASTSGRGFAVSTYANALSAVQTGSVTCNANLATLAAMGAPTVANSDYVVIPAVGNLDSSITTSCSAVIRILESTEANGRKPSTPAGFITYNLGN
jgi:prepilin-type N-terminal cleavage/methylation domain-containing protein